MATLSPLTFFSFVAVEPASREAYNRWHRYDHLPENLALPGVLWGERWSRVRREEESNLDYDATEFLAMYWFREPIGPAIDEWAHLGADSFEWGRGPLMPGVSRELLGFFRPTKGYVRPDIPISLRALPIRPNQGIHVTVTHFAEPRAPATHDHHSWQAQVLMPQLLQLPGVVGGWNFAFSHYQQHTSMPFSMDGHMEPGQLRITMIYFDGDPVSTGARIEAAYVDASQVAVPSSPSHHVSAPTGGASHDSKVQVRAQMLFERLAI